MRPTAQTLDLDAIKEANQQDTDGHTQGRRQVGGRHHTNNVFVAKRGAYAAPQHRNGIDGQHVHGVHQENPDKYRQRQGRYELAAGGIADHAFGLIFDHFGQHFYRGLETAWHTRGGFAGGAPQEKTRQHAQHDGGH